MIVYQYLYYKRIAGVLHTLDSGSVL